MIIDLPTMDHWPANSGIYFLLPELHQKVTFRTLNEVAEVFAAESSQAEFEMINGTMRIGYASLAPLLSTKIMGYDTLLINEVLPSNVFSQQ
jgi:hypothetical protein